MTGNNFAVTSGQRRPDEDMLREEEGVIKCCKHIPEVSVAIRFPESKMAAKMAAKIFNF